MYETNTYDDDYTNAKKQFLRLLKRSKILTQQVDSSESVNFILDLQKETDLSYEDTMLFINTFFQTIKERVFGCEPVVLKDIGTFYIYDLNKKRFLEREIVKPVRYFKSFFTFRIDDAFRRKRMEAYTIIEKLDPTKECAPTWIIEKSNDKNLTNK